MPNNTSKCDRCELSIIVGETHDCPLDSMTAYGLVLIEGRWYIDTVIRGIIFKNMNIKHIEPLPVPSWIIMNANTHFSTPKRDTSQDDRTIIIIIIIIFLQPMRCKSTVLLCTHHQQLLFCLSKQFLCEWGCQDFNAYRYS